MYVHPPVRKKIPNFILASFHNDITITDIDLIMPYSTFHEQQQKKTYINFFIESK